MMKTNLLGLDWKVFNNAADLIDRDGWSPKVFNGRCVWVAVSDVLNGHIHSHDVNPRAWARYVDVICEWFGVDSLTRLYNLNDNQPEESGHIWATTNLRRIARKVKD